MERPQDPEVQTSREEVRPREQGALELLKALAAVHTTLFVDGHQELAERLQRLHHQLDTANESVSTIRQAFRGIAPQIRNAYGDVLAKHLASLREHMKALALDPGKVGSGEIMEAQKVHEHSSEVKRLVRELAEFNLYVAQLK